MRVDFICDQCDIFTVQNHTQSLVLKPLPHGISIISKRDSLVSLENKLYSGGIQPSIDWAPRRNS